MEAWTIATLVAILPGMAALPWGRAGIRRRQLDRDRLACAAGASWRAAFVNPIHIHRQRPQSLRRWCRSVISRPPERGRNQLSFLLIAVWVTACQYPSADILPAAKEQPVEMDRSNHTENGMRALIITDITGVATTEDDVERMGEDEAERIVATYELGVLQKRLVALQERDPQSGTPVGEEIRVLNRHISFYVDYLKQLSEYPSDEEVPDGYCDWPPTAFLRLENKVDVLPFDAFGGYVTANGRASHTTAFIAEHRVTMT